ncbi:hypothetical protein LB570_09985, partial [Mesorhizobium sp. BR1-1-5]|nr:hypothetical protein [Mesorhizobium sp. BR1-1-5]
CSLRHVFSPLECWLGAQAKMKKPIGHLPLKIIEMFDDMISQLGKTGWWEFDGSPDVFANRMLDACKSDQWGKCSEEIIEFVFDMATQVRDRRGPNELRTHCLYAAVRLLAFVPASSDVTFWEEEADSFGYMTGKRFSRRNHVSFDLTIGPRQ